MSKTKWTFDMTIGVEMTPEEVALVGREPIVLDNGRVFCPLAIGVRASTVPDEDLSEDEAQRKAIATACFYFKKDNPEWTDAKLVGLNSRLTRRSLVR